MVNIVVVREVICDRLWRQVTHTKQQPGYLVSQ